MAGPSIDPFEIASIAKRTAETIRRLPSLMKEIVESNPWPPFSEVSKRLDPTKLDVDFMDVALYVERHWTPAHAQKLVGQIHKATDTVRDFLNVYETVTTKYQRENLSWRREDGATFLVVCMMIAKEVAQWAADIEDRAERDGQSRGQSTDVAGDAKIGPVQEWQPPPGHVGTKEICHHERFRKKGTSPVPSTIQRWVERDKRQADKNHTDLVNVVQAPDTHENHYPESWIRQQIDLWNPRQKLRDHAA